jgi:CheY-like chemotaxis protein
MEPLTLAGPAHPKAAHILLVEDTPVNREVVIGMLELLGHQVNIAENGQSAVEALAQTTYDLVLMDCQMPIMDGFTATGVLRGRERIAGSRRRLPIIALTAHALKGDRERCFVAGMDDYLTKPFTLHQLQALLARWIPVAAGSSDPSSEPDCPTAPAQAVIDEAAWEGIRALQRPDRPNILHKTLTLYLAHSQLLIEQLQQVITTPDMSFVQAAAHTLKSSSAQLGAHHLAQLCKEVEAACQAGAIDQLSTRISSLVAEHRDVCVAMRYVLTSSQQE